MIIYLFRPNTQKKQLQHLMNLFANKRMLSDKPLATLAVCR
jgi:hypothetical protein